MKVYKLKVRSPFIGGGNVSVEYYYEFNNKNEKAAYFAPNNGSWRFSYWYNNDLNDGYSIDDLCSWYDRMLCYTLDGDNEMPIISKKVGLLIVGGSNWKFKEDFIVGESAKFILGLIFVHIECIYDGRACDVPEEFRFNLSKSQQEVEGLDELDDDEYLE